MRKHNDLIGEMLSKTPVKASNNSNLSTLKSMEETAKREGYKPSWVSKKEMIAKRIESAESAADIDEINQLIAAYNLSCPPPMQVYPISLKYLDKCKELWRTKLV